MKDSFDGVDSEEGKLFAVDGEAGDVAGGGVVEEMGEFGDVSWAVLGWAKMGYFLVLEKNAHFLSQIKHQIF